MNHRTHWGAVLFTIVIAAAALWVFSGSLFAPLARPTGTAAPSVEAEAVEPSSLRTPLPEELHSQWYTQTVAPVLTVGETATVTLQFRNVGHAAWIKNSPSEIRLGEVGERPLPPEMRLHWFAPNRPAAQSESIVDERQLATFTFKVAGAVPGTFRLRLRPVVDGVKWLDDEGVFVDITVRG